MDEPTQTESASETDQTGGSSDGAVADGSAGGTEESGGSQGGSAATDLSRAQETIRSLQADRDRARAELAAAQASASSAGSGDEAGSSGEFDPVEFRRSLIADVHSATALQTAAVTLRTEFPHADPALFAPDRLVGFGSVESLRLAAQGSHLRVAAALEGERAAIEASLRAEFEAKYGSGAGSASGGGTEGATGDPTPAQVAAMTMDELDQLETSNPGVLDRVLRSAPQT